MKVSHAMRIKSVKHTGQIHFISCCIVAQTLEYWCKIFLCSHFCKSYFHSFERDELCVTQEDVKNLFILDKLLRRLICASHFSRRNCCIWLPSEGMTLRCLSCPVLRLWYCPTEGGFATGERSGCSFPERSNSARTEIKMREFIAQKH